MSQSSPQPSQPASRRAANSRRRKVARRRQAGCLFVLLILIALAVLVIRFVFFNEEKESIPRTEENELWITSTAFVYDNQACRNLDELRQALTDSPPTDTVHLIAQDTFPSALENAQALLTEMGIPYE